MAKAKIKVRDIVTEKIIGMLKEGVIPWRRPWRLIGRNRNLVTHRHRGGYRGINIWLLAGSPYSSPWWVTYRQAKMLGGQVRKGESSTLVVFWKWFEGAMTDDEGEPILDGNGEPRLKRTPMMRYYHVFNVEQCDGLEAKIPEEEEAPTVDPIEAGEALIAAMPQRPEIKFGGDRAFYSPFLDYVQLPERDNFESAEGYYATAFHELAHATGHSSRLSRFEDNTNPSMFGSTSYSQEELVAEMGAAFLMADAGIEADERLENAAAYISTWMKRIADDTSLVVVAAQAAQKAADFILGTTYEAAKPSELKEAA